MSTYSYTAYDAMGRVTAYNQSTTGAGTYSMSATYNLAGLMVDETYPSTKVIHTEYDDAGRVAGVKNAANTTYYAGSVASDSTNRIQYAEHGAVSAMKLGNNLWEKTTFNTRLQPTQIELGTSSTPSSIVQLDYTYGVMVGGNLDTTLNNGNVQSQTVTVGSNIIKQSYTYDQVNRLLSAAETYNQAARWTQSYTFDQVGNRTGLANTGIDVLPTTSTPTVSSSTNRISAAGYVYDNGGNLKDEPAALNKHYKYDAENRLVDFNSGATQYLYDGDGHRVKKITVGSQTTTTVFVYNAGGQLIAEYTNDPVPPPVGGGGTSYLTTDHLGSTRVVTNSAGAVKARYDYLAYGEELPSSVGGRSSIGGYGGADSTRQKFTQKERDSESGLDYFLARYYSSAQSRFTSVDPLRASARIGAPQSWNRYTYVLNNPLRFVDPDGQKEEDQDNTYGITTTTTTQVIIQERGGGQVVQQATVTITETQTQTVNENGAVVRTDPVRTSATALNTGDAPREYSQTQLDTMANVAQNVVGVSREKGLDPAIALGIAQTETNLGTRQNNESGNPEWKRSEINPMQLSGGRAKGGDLRSNIAGAIDVYTAAAGGTQRKKLENYNSQPGIKEAYAVSAERRVGQVRSSVSVMVTCGSADGFREPKR